MSRGDTPPGASESVEAQLNEQLRRLIRSERAQYRSQRALQIQLRRVRLLNEFAIDASHLEGTTALLRRGVKLLLELFPYEHGVALLCEQDHLRCVTAWSIDGASSFVPRPVLAVTDALSSALQWPRLLTGATLENEPRLAELVRHVFGEQDATADELHRILVLPLWDRPTRPMGALLCRRVSKFSPVERPLPSDGDTDLLQVLGRQIAGAISKALLVEDLRQSYGQLAAAQEELVRQERLAAVGELAAQIAHEVRNPVGAISNAVSHLKKFAAPEGDSAALLGMVAEESQRLARMVEDLLDFARPRPPQRTLASLAEIVESAVEGISRSGALEGIRIQRELSPEVPSVRVDARMIRQVLLNLVLNAAQAMDGEGVLSLSTRIEDSGGQQWARIDVADTGPGVPPEVAGKLFQPFFTTKAAGTGLGLAVVRRLMEVHHGRASFSSTPGRGTTFTLYLPLTESEATPDEHRRVGS